MMGLPCGEEIMIVGRTVWTQSTSVTDGRTDRITITDTVQTASHGKNGYIAMHSRWVGYQFMLSFPLVCCVCIGWAPWSVLNSDWPYSSSAAATTRRRRIWQEICTGRLTTTPDNVWDRQPHTSWSCHVHDSAPLAIEHSELLQRAYGTICHLLSALRLLWTPSRDILRHTSSTVHTAADVLFLTFFTILLCVLEATAYGTLNLTFLTN